MKGENTVSNEKDYEVTEEMKKDLENEEVSQNSEGEAENNSEVLEDQEFEGLNEKEDPSEETKNLLSTIMDENKKLSNELEALKDRLVRTSAEYDNFRRRTAKEKEGIYTDACEDVLKNMLPVLDNLERASTVQGSVDDIKKGIEMTMRQFKDSLEKLQVEEIATDGEFNPNHHNAVMHIDDDSYGKNTIVEVFQKGYKRGDKVLRHSMVKVAN